jgi:hypothetical protein
MDEWAREGWTVLEGPIEFHELEEFLGESPSLFEFKRCYAMTGRFKGSKSFVSEKSPGLQACGFVAYRRRK